MIPDFQSCMLPFLRKLEDGSVHSMTEIQNALIREFHLTETDVKEMLPSNRTTRFRSNVGWAKTHMQKAGLLETPQRAQYRITEAGLRLLQTRPEHINMKLLFNYPAYKEWIALSNRNSEPKRNSKQESECVIPVSYTHLDVYKRQGCEQRLYRHREQQTGRYRPSDGESESLFAY